MNIQTKTLVKLKSDDGLVEVYEDIPLRKKYRVDLDRIELQTFWHIEQEVKHQKYMVWDVEGQRYFPAELLGITPIQ